MDMASPGEPPQSDDAALDTAVVAPNQIVRAAPRWAVLAASTFFCALLVWLVGYLWVAIPGPWFGNVPVQTAIGSRLTLTRGVGHVEGTRFLLQGTDDGGIAIVSLVATLLAT